MPYKDITKRREADKRSKAKKLAERKAAGLVRKEIWINPEWWEKIKEFINQLKD